MSTQKDTSHKFYIKQVEGIIKQLFTDLIDLSDLDSRKSSDKETNFLSRGLAAYSLYVLANVNANIAAEAVVDGYTDNGIDAILFDKSQNILWLVQSKWTQKVKGQPATGDMKKFKDGVLDLRDYKLGRFNEKIRSKENEIIEALESPGINIKVVIAYTGKVFSKHNRETLEDLVEDLNDYDDIGNYEIFDLERAFKALTESLNSNQIEVEFKLSNWGKVEEPYQAFYGQICAADVAEWWMKYRSRLFNKNIRDFIGSSDVNNEIARTIREEPYFFWYFNNGITVLCQEIRKRDISRNRNTGDFICKGISVINGAQTIGSIGSIYQDHPEKVEDAEIFIKFISLEHCPEDFAVRVTRATNTQNRVENRDFVSLDPEQERLMQNLRSINVDYHYKRSSTLNNDERSFNLADATIALACAHPDVALTVLTKREISRLWSDTSKEPYITIFNKNLPEIKLWRAVEIYREVHSILYQREELALAKGDKENSLFYNHGNNFILHIVFQKLKKDVLLIIDDTEFEGYKQRVLPALIENSVENTQNILAANYPHVTPGRFFRSFIKCHEFKQAILPDR